MIRVALAAAAGGLAVVAASSACTSDHEHVPQPTETSPTIDRSCPAVPPTLPHPSVSPAGAEGPVFEGQTYRLDLLIYATGFEVQKTGIYNEIRGRDGREINETYADGIRTLFGVHTHGYPNLFIMGGYQASFQFNLTFMLQCQGDHIA